MLKPYKFQIVAVCQEVNDDVVTAEQAVAGPNGAPAEVFGIAGLHKFADEFEGQLAAAVNNVTPLPNRAQRRSKRPA